MNIGKRPKPVIKQLLKERGILLLQFSHDLGICETVASRISNGWLIPRDPKARRKIADYLDISEAEIFNSSK
jgi:hypothetical protein